MTEQAVIDQVTHALTGRFWIGQRVRYLNPQHEVYGDGTGVIQEIDERLGTAKVLFDRRTRHGQYSDSIFFWALRPL